LVQNIFHDCAGFFETTDQCVGGRDFSNRRGTGNRKMCAMDFSSPKNISKLLKIGHKFTSKQG
jgi:hypothetical protein